MVINLSISVQEVSDASGFEKKERLRPIPDSMTLPQKQTNKQTNKSRCTTGFNRVVTNLANLATLD